MNPFSNTTNEGSSTAPTTSTYTSRFGSGAEQDRYGAHFGIGSEGFDRLKGVAMAKGIGAEQDRYGSHFTLDHEKVRAAAESILKAKGTGAEQDRHAMHFGLGNDGWERAKRLAAMKGEGAEQDRYGSHFSVDRHTVERAAQSIQDGAKNVAEKK